jgi:uncharacterized RDD family membrane protein YckC
MSAVETQYCTECGKAFPADDLFEYQDRRVCLECKPAFAQRLRQGASLPNQLEYGGFWIRFAARLLDGIILAVANVAIDALILAGFGVGRSPISQRSPLPGILILAVNIVMAVLYEAGFLVRSGATPGKMVLGLRVVTAEGGPLSWGRAVGRYLGLWLDNFTLGIGFIIAAFDAEKRALHDHICGTRVVRNAAVQALMAR